MTHAERLTAALDASNPATALRAVVLELATEGCPKGDISARLEKLLLDLRGRTDRPASEEDAILDVLDGLADWCRPDARLLPEQTSASSRPRGLEAHNEPSADPAE